MATFGQFWGKIGNFLIHHLVTLLLVSLKALLRSQVAIRLLVQRTLTIGGSITVWLTSCLTGLDLTKQVKLFLID